jgi:heme exporter protein B
VLLLPLIIPVIIPAVMATGTILTDGGLGSISSELKLLIVYDLIFFVVGQLVFEYTVMD